MEINISSNRATTIIKKQISNNSLSHAYLIETNTGNDYHDKIVEIIKLILCNNKHGQADYCQLCSSIDNNTCSDLKIIDTDLTQIKKEELLKIKENFKTTSNRDKRLYVIYDAEKLNSSSANTILKFLEEPDPGIIAILVAKNRYSVLETIVSRCQILSFTGDTVIEKNNEEIATVLYKLLTDKEIYLSYKINLENVFINKNDTKAILETMEMILYKVINNKALANEEENVFKSISTDKIIKVIIIIEEEKQKLNYNINFKLWLSAFFVRLMEVS